MDSIFCPACQASRALKGYRVNRYRCAECGYDFKRCTGCQALYPLSEYGANRWRCTDCLNSYKRGCRKERADDRVVHYRTYTAGYYQANRERIIAKQAALTLASRMTVLRHYGGDPPACACCGEATVEFLTIDHINGNGGQHRKELGGLGQGRAFYRWIIRNLFPSALRVLCFNCNCARGLYGYCPHEASVPSTGS